MAIGNLVNNFRTFLITSWPSISSILELIDWNQSPYFLENWIQVNWELMVEQQILEDNQYLQPYGYDNTPACRLSDKGSQATHQVMCSLNKDKNCKKYVFLAFVACKDGGNYKIEAPFDYVDVEEMNTGNRITLPIERLHFFLEKINQ